MQHRFHMIYDGVVNWYEQFVLIGCPPAPSDKGYKLLTIHDTSIYFTDFTYNVDMHIYVIYAARITPCDALFMSAISILCNDNLFYSLVVGYIITQPDVLHMDNITRPYEWPCMTFTSHTHPLINCSLIPYISAIV